MTTKKDSPVYRAISCHLALLTEEQLANAYNASKQALEAARVEYKATDTADIAARSFWAHATDNAFGVMWHCQQEHERRKKNPMLRLAVAI